MAHIEDSTEAYILTIMGPIRKLVHSMYKDFLSFKNENFPLKNFDIFLIFAQNIDCGYTLARRF